MALGLSLCPRCRGFIPNNEQPGQFPGAISRVDGAEICSKCGMEEALGPRLTEALVKTVKTPKEMEEAKHLAEFYSDLEDLKSAEKISVKTCLHSEWRWLDCDECGDRGETCDEKVCVDCGASVS